MNVDVADVTLQRLELYREVIEKIVTTIESNSFNIQIMQRNQSP
jgi:hypothetical protein